MMKTTRFARLIATTGRTTASATTTRRVLLSTTRLVRATESPAGVFHKEDFTAQDPYPLQNRTDPRTGEGAIPMDESLTPHAPIDRSGEAVETKRARLLWQSRKRGILETDLLLSTFAAKYLEGMDEQALVLYDALLDEPDWEIYYYATAKKEPAERFRGTKLLEQLRAHVRNEEKVTRSMPSLKDMSANYRADQATDGIHTKQAASSVDERPAEEVEAEQKPELKEKIKPEDRDPAVIAS